MIVSVVSRHYDSTIALLTLIVVVMPKANSESSSSSSSSGSHSDSNVLRHPPATIFEQHVISLKFVGIVVGKQGTMIRKMTEQTDCRIDVDRDSHDGLNKVRRGRCAEEINFHRLLFEG